MKRFLCLLLGHHYTLFHTIYTSPVVTTLYRCVRCRKIIAAFNNTEPE